MSVTVNALQTVDVPLGTPLAVVGEHSGDLSLYPQGVGHGPVMTMTPADWYRLRESADAAIAVWRKRARFEGYTACEGTEVGD